VGVSKLEIASSATIREESLEVEIRILSSGSTHIELNSSPSNNSHILPLIIYHHSFRLSTKNQSRVRQLRCKPPREFGPTASPIPD
jgi:hypothetical protein